MPNHCLTRQHLSKPSPRGCTWCKMTSQLYPCQIQVCLLAMPPEGDRWPGVQPGHWLSMHEELYEHAQYNHAVHKPQDQRGHHPSEPATRICNGHPKQGKVRVNLDTKSPAIGGAEDPEGCLATLATCGINFCKGCSLIRKHLYLQLFIQTPSHNTPSQIKVVIFTHQVYKKRKSTKPTNQTESALSFLRVPCILIFLLNTSICTHYFSVIFWS